ATTRLGADEAPAQVVVKLVKRCNKDAHERLAKENLAPKLFLCERVIGNLIVVVMERVPGQPLHMAHYSPLGLEAQRKVFDGLRQAIKALERDGLVHGDLRAPNIVVSPKSGQVKVIDFDWAAKQDEGFYPDTINTDSDVLREQ
ncbi:hypothetical protein BJ912DRAFT_845924, partial [Pholiota molesta]